MNSYQFHFVTYVESCASERTARGGRSRISDARVDPSTDDRVAPRASHPMMRREYGCTMHVLKNGRATTRTRTTRVRGRPRRRTTRALFPSSSLASWIVFLSLKPCAILIVAFHFHYVHSKLCSRLVVSHSSYSSSPRDRTRFSPHGHRRAFRA